MNYFPLADFPTDEDLNDLNLTSWNCKIMAKKTDLFRAPQKGEWFLSGAIPKAYRAKNDLSDEYWILTLVKVKKVTKFVELD